MTGPRTQVRLLLAHARRLGWRTAIRIRAYDYWKKMRLPVPDVITLAPANALHPLRMRTGKSSDRDVFGQIFFCQEYRHVPLDRPASIVDLGANVGYSSAYFLSMYPSAQVVAVEPDDRNVAMCSENLRAYGSRATVIHGAVWADCRILTLSVGRYRDGREWSTQVVAEPTEDVGAKSVRGYDMESILARCDSPVIDLVKIDIEGAERQLFAGATDSWLPRVRNLCIELHGDECARIFWSALGEYDYETATAGELTICRNIRRRLG